jgi:type I restriction enzyme S subunit
VTRSRHSGGSLGVSGGWNPVTDHLDLWTTALMVKATAGRGNSGRLEAYGIKKVRALILELAVRGMLVPQDAGDEPANILLEKIEKEKKRLDKEGTLARQSSLPEVTNDDVYFGLPSGWLWSRLGEVTNYGVTDKAEPEDVAEDTWVLDLEDVEKETSRLLQKIRFSEKPFRSAKNRFLEGDVIYGKLRPYLDKVLVADEDGVCTTEMMPVRGYAGIYPFYLRLVMKTPYFINYADDSTHGMNLPRLGTDKARMALFPLAPLSEQHRIVAKVDELMALCDQLEQQQGHGIEAHRTLVETLLDTLTRVESAQEFAVAWSRIADHFDTLFTTEHSIDQLKKSFLRLAVMGKLASQNPDDESASALLGDIFKKRAIKAKKKCGEVEKCESTAIDTDVLYKLPAGWVWGRLGAICQVERGGSPRPISAYLTNDKDGLNWIKIGDTDVGGKYITSTEEKIRKEGLSKSRMVYPGDFLLTNSMSFGRPYITKIEGCIHDGWLRIHPPEQLDKDYLYYLLSSTYVADFFRAAVAGAVVMNLNADKVRKLPIALPPLAEQHRIVAKVDELMALCDALKARFAEAQATQIHLADAIFEQTVAAPEAMVA